MLRRSLKSKLKSTAKPDSSSGEFTADFRHEFDVETREMLRGRFLLFDGLVGALWLLMLGLGVYRLLGGNVIDLASGGLQVDLGAVSRSQSLEFARAIASPIFELVALAVYVAAFLAVRRGRFSDRDLVRLTFALVMVDGVLRILMHHMKVDGGGGLAGVMFAHVLACALLPWSPKQSLGPILPLVALNFVLSAFIGESDLGSRLLGAGFAAMVAVPGLFISWLKHSRRVEGYKTRFLQRRYGELRRELVDARRIHEALFPAPMTTGPLRFTYRYEPMRQIGGDYLYARFCPSDSGPEVGSEGESGGGSGVGALSVVVLDVTGHGIPAALTVNRLHGELERVFAETPTVSPGEVLRLLNRYVHLTLANHSVYVTALCLKFDCGMSQLSYASGGHPPAFLRAVDGTIHQLQSTAFVLGACADADFNSDPVTMAFGPGDAVIAYTDGAIEARDKNGRMLGVQGFLKLVASLPGNTGTVGEPSAAPMMNGMARGREAARPGSRAGSGSGSGADVGSSRVWSEMLLNAVESHRDGPPADDTLVIEVLRGA